MHFAESGSKGVNSSNFSNVTIFVKFIIVIYIRVAPGYLLLTGAVYCTNKVLDGPCPCRLTS